LPDGRQYVHLGIQKSLEVLDAKDNLKRDNSSLLLQSNVGGVPLFESSSTCPRPIL
jgi:hypothetical protein